MIRLNRKGFTLVEIMIVVAIIALLAAIAIPNLLRARINANEAAAQATLKSIAAALESYAAAESQYPAAYASLTGASPPYFSKPLNGVTTGGYLYDCDDAADLTTGGYTVAATAQGQENYDYQITTGARLQRKTAGGGSYADF